MLIVASYDPGKKGRHRAVWRTECLMQARELCVAGMDREDSHEQATL